MQPASTGGGRTRSGTLASSSSAAAGRSSFHPPANRESFKDLLVFEERLKQNAERLQKQRRKYEAFLLTLSGVIAYLGYSVFVLPSIYSLVHYSNVAMLLVAATTLVLFFATGMYSEKIAYAHKFVPQANRALRPFNIYLNTRRRSRFAFVSKWFNSTPAAAAAGVGAPLSRTSSIRSNASSTSTASGSGSGGGAPLSRQTSNASSASSASGNGCKSPPASPPLSPMTSPPESPSATASSRTIDLPSLPPVPTAASSASATSSIAPSTSPPQGAVTRASPVVNSNPSRQPVPLPPIPPSRNPRGEIIFSSRVSPAFREGYERYRGEWERRRAEAKRAAKDAKKQGKGKHIGAGKGFGSSGGRGGVSWLGWGRGSRTELGATEKDGSTGEKEVDFASQRHDDRSQPTPNGDDDRPRDRMRFQSPTPPPPSSHASNELHPIPMASSSQPGTSTGRTAFRHAPLPRSDSERSDASAVESTRPRMAMARRRTPSPSDSEGARLRRDAEFDEAGTFRDPSRSSLDTDRRAYAPDHKRYDTPNDSGIESASLGLSSSPTLSSSSLFSTDNGRDFELRQKPLRTRGGQSASVSGVASSAEEVVPVPDRSSTPSAATLSGAATRIRAESFSDLLTYEGEVDDEDQRGVLGSAARLPRLERSNSMRRGG